MMIIGCDFHPSWQQVSWLDTETGETGERKLVQASGDAERFYRQVAAPALIGMEATGNYHWLVIIRARVKNELQHLCLNKGVQRKHKLWEPSGTADLARTTAEAVGRAPARRFAQADGDARPADRAAGSGGQSRSSARQNGAASSNPTRSRSDHGAGLR